MQRYLSPVILSEAKDPLHAAASNALSRVYHD